MKRSFSLVLVLAATVVWAQPGREGKLQVGDAAPEFRLRRLHSEQQVALSQFKNQKPVALVFGSYT